MSELKTRIVHLEGGQQRRHGDNPSTCLMVVDKKPRAASFRDLFVRNYAAIRTRCTAFAQSGLAVVAVDAFTGELAGVLCVAAKIHAANSAIVGRHTLTDLYLDGDKAISLRHLAVVLSPVSSSADDVCFRVIDLRTANAFRDEHGRKFEALVAEGPMFIRCGNYVLFCLPTGEMVDWPALAKDGWACIPERVYLRTDEAEPDRWQRKRGLVSPNSPKRQPARTPNQRLSPDNRRVEVTRVQSILGPVRARTRLVTEGEEPVGTLRICTEIGVQSLLVGHSALRRGILLGRYQRCDVDGTKVLTSDSISRVHLLVVEINDRVYAIDTASTNGTWTTDQDSEVRIASLDNGEELNLGNSLATVRWCPVR